VRLFIILWCLTFSSFAAGIIGDIILQTGNAVIERNDGEDIKAEDELDIVYQVICEMKGADKDAIVQRILLATGIPVYNSKFNCIQNIVQRQLDFKKVL